MATRLDKIMAPILKEKCDAAFKAGYKKGFEAGGKNMSLAYQNEINSIKRKLGGKRFLLKENGDLIPMDQQWISVKDRLPEAGETVLCLMPSKECWVATWNEVDDRMWSDGEWWASETFVTHWMPLPEPPKGG